jgi:hypothetical protein
MSAHYCTISPSYAALSGMTCPHRFLQDPAQLARPLCVDGALLAGEVSHQQANPAGPTAITPPWVLTSTMKVGRVEKSACSRDHYFFLFVFFGQDG